jgi:hypothetical protein
VHKATKGQGCQSLISIVVTRCHGHVRAIIIKIIVGVKSQTHKEKDCTESIMASGPMPV